MPDSIGSGLKIRGVESIMRSPIISVSLYIEVGNECEVVAKSLMVDERDLPNGVSTSMRCQDGVLIYQVSASIDEPSSILTAYNTLDDLIRNLRAALAAL